MFHMLLLEQGITRKKQVDKELEIELKIDDNIEYEVEAIQDSTVYA